MPPNETINLLDVVSHCSRRGDEPLESLRRAGPGEAPDPNPIDDQSQGYPLEDSTCAQVRLTAW
jgi:hypothetical protein